MFGLIVIAAAWPVATLPQVIAGRQAKAAIEPQTDKLRDEVDGLLIQAATGGDSGTGILPLNRFGYFINAFASTSDLCC